MNNATLKQIAVHGAFGKTGHAFVVQTAKTRQHGRGQHRDVGQAFAQRGQLMSQDPSTLPKPEEVKSMMQAFTAGGLNTMGDIKQAVEQGPINIKLAKSLALQQANGAGSDSSVNAETGEIARRAIEKANLWLDTACEFNPAQGETQLLTRAGWVEDTIDAWAQFASPVAESMNDALASILSQRFGDGRIQTEISGVSPEPHRNSDSGRDEESGEADAVVGNVVRHAVGACRCCLWVPGVRLALGNYARTSLLYFRSGTYC